MCEFLVTLLISLGLILLLTFVGLLLYSGLLFKINVKTGNLPIKNVTIAYKFKEGLLKDRGATFSESHRIGPKLSSVCVYYDNPIEGGKCRYAVGSILCEGDEQPDEDLQRLYQAHGFKLFSLPQVQYGVTTLLPYKTCLFHILATHRVLAALTKYIKERGLPAYPYVDISEADHTYFICPLSRQEEFLVPEFIEAENRRQTRPKEDGQSDSTDAESCTARTSANRDAPLALSAVRCPPQPAREGEEGLGVLSQPFDMRSNESVSSSSSFEELDWQEGPKGSEGEESISEDLLTSPQTSD